MEDAAELLRECACLRAKITEARAAAVDTTFDQATADVQLLPKLKWRELCTLQGHLAKVCALHWRHDSRQLASCAQDGKVIFWDVQSRSIENVLQSKSQWLLTVAYSLSGSLVASGGLDNLCTVFSVSSSSQSHQTHCELAGHHGYVSCVRFVGDEKAVTASGDRSCALWDVATGKLLTRFHGHANDVTHLAVAKHGSCFVSVSCDRSCRVWDLRELNQRQVLEGHEQDVTGVCLFPQNDFAFATSSDDCTCRLWDLRADQEVAIYCDDQVSAGSTCVAFSNSGRLLFAGYDDFVCHTWDTLVQERVGALSGHDNRLSYVAIPENGMAVCTGSWDTTVKIWTG